MCSEYHSDADLSLPGTALYRAGLRPDTFLYMELDGYSLRGKEYYQNKGF